MSVDRVKQVVSHLVPGSTKGRAALLRNSPDDVVITMAIRSPLCKAKKGAFKDTKSDEMLYEIFKQAVARSTIDPALIQDISVGTVLTAGAPYQARYAALAAGIPETVPLQTINRWCSSGLMAVTDISNKIRAGQIEIGLAVGFESMTDRFAPPLLVYTMALSDVIKASQAAQDASMPMGWTSENVAADFDISRNEMDELAALSYQRAEKAQKEGIFDAEIVPFTAYVNDPATGQRTTKVVTKDDGIRYGTTKENLMKIRPAFPQWGRGQTTGGNASQITDGAAAVLLMTRRKAEQLGLKILAKHVTTSVCGLAPRIMGIGPSIAIPMVLEATGLSKDDVDLFEINEAFASMYVYCVKKLGLDINKVNVHGGAIALGHPLDKSSIILALDVIATGLNALARRKGKVSPSDAADGRQRVGLKFVSPDPRYIDQLAASSPYFLSLTPSPDRRRDRDREVDRKRDDRQRYRDDERERDKDRDRYRERRRDDDYDSSRRDRDRDYDSSSRRDRDRDRDRRRDRSADKYESSSRRKDRY
ncbi:hypothetical protein NUW54_g5214 [Trametes sanguinea]|uniref:Uncharacterized protein n=1 Tax=Trametes sanguinea TaxID=158606 RepID=A0ACC1PVR7_9APHY|nr:hypothetical protein NUW54_g5214 [Trametes sanguinea]